MKAFFQCGVMSAECGIEVCSKQERFSSLPTCGSVFHTPHSSLRTVTALGWNRTSDLLLRRQTLYPLSYKREHQSILAKMPACANPAPARDGDTRAAQFQFQTPAALG